jgi:hypothetical protein
MNKKELEAQYAEMFDASDVEWEIIETKRANKINIQFTKESGRFNLITIYLSMKLMIEKIEMQMGLLDDAGDTEH